MIPDEAFARTPGPAELRSSRPRLCERSDCPFCRHHGPHRQAPVSAHKAGRRAVISRPGVLHAKGAHNRPAGSALILCTAVQPRQRADLPRTTRQLRHHVPVPPPDAARQNLDQPAIGLQQASPFGADRRSASSWYRSTAWRWVTGVVRENSRRPIPFSADH